jgi:hypothetical protein
MAEPLLVGETFDGGENHWQHAQEMAHILAGIGGSTAMQAACYLVYACDHLSKPAEVLGKAFGPGLASLAIETHKLLHVQRQARRGMRAAGAEAGTDSAMARQAARVDPSAQATLAMSDVPFLRSRPGKRRSATRATMAGVMKKETMSRQTMTMKM